MSLVVSLSYGLSSFGITLIHNVFLLYYVQVFISVYKISEGAFFWGQLLFLLWNSINDPLFGYLLDKTALQEITQSSSRVSISTFSKRLKALRIGGPLLALSFLTFWYPWASPTIQFIICINLYDGFLTYVDLNHQALIADLTLDSSERANLNRWNSFFSVFACVSVFLSYNYWDTQDLTAFQNFTSIIAIISIASFLISYQGLNYALSQGWIIPNTPQIEVKKKVTPQSMDSSIKQWFSFLKQIGTQPNFIYFSIMHLLQVFHCHFNSNFFPLFLDVLFGNELSKSTKSILLASSFIFPHLNNVIFSSLSQRYGLHKVVMFLFFAKLSFALITYFLGFNYFYIMIIFVLSNRIFTEGTCKLISLCIGDLVDEDFVIHDRSESVSAFVFGTASLFAKPGQTLAPLFGTFVLAHFTKSRFNNDNDDESNPPLFDDRIVMFNMAIFVAVMCAVSQIIAWAKFSLHGENLENIKLKANSKNKMEYDP